MLKKSKQLCTAIISLVIMLALFLGLSVGALESVKASAQTQESNEVIAATDRQSGWYVVGKGAGSLNLCSWTEYLSDYRLTGTSLDDADAEYQNYYGIWHTDLMLLYEGDQFKFLYESGDWEYPSDSGWSDNIVAQYTNLEDNNVGHSFSSAGYYNIQVDVSGYYVFYLYVIQTDSGVVITLNFTRDPNQEVPPLRTGENMYVVGLIQYYPSSVWPSYSGSVPQNDIKMSYHSETETWTSPTIYFTTRDEFKVYNVINECFYPSGADDNYTVEKAGWYIVEYVSHADNFAVVPANRPTPEEHAMQPGWYIVGSGAGSLKECSWTEYLPEYRLNGLASSVECIYDDYYGTWKTESVLLYEGDQFQFLYENGDWATTNESRWTYNVRADYSNLSSAAEGYLNVVGRNNIQVLTSGYYTFYVHVSYTGSSVQIDITFTVDSTKVPEIGLLDIYLVGNIASMPNCGWPSEVDVATNCIKMTYNPTTGRYVSPVIFFQPGDMFKVYNLSNDTYYPSGTNDNMQVTGPGWGYIVWVPYSQEPSIESAR